jgi:2'-5' RNA ligase
VTYYFVLRFDRETEKRFDAVTRAVAERGANRYMIDAGIPPHVTVSSFCAERPDDVKTVIDENRSLFAAGELIWVSLGAFPPQVLFAAPVLSEYLQDFCVKLNRLISPLAEAGDYGHYLPYQWVPHTTLATQMGESELHAAFETAVRHFTPFGGRSNRLILAEGDPYKELAVWDLS